MGSIATQHQGIYFRIVHGSKGYQHIFCRLIGGVGLQHAVVETFVGVLGLIHGARLRGDVETSSLLN